MREADDGKDFQALGEGHDDQGRGQDENQGGKNGSFAHFEVSISYQNGLQKVEGNLGGGESLPPASGTSPSLPNR